MGNHSSGSEQDISGDNFNVQYSIRNEKAKVNCNLEYDACYM